MRTCFFTAVLTGLFTLIAYDSDAEQKEFVYSELTASVVEWSA